MSPRTTSIRIPATLPSWSRASNTAATGQLSRALRNVEEVAKVGSELGAGCPQHAARGVDATLSVRQRVDQLVDEPRGVGLVAFLPDHEHGGQDRAEHCPVRDRNQLRDVSD